MQRTLITPRLPNVWSASKEKPKVPSIIIPRAPNHASSLIDYDKVVPTTKVPLRTEPTPHSLTVPLSPASSTSTSSQSSYVDGSVPDVLAIADLFATLKRTVSTLHSTFDSLGMQTEKMANLAPAIQADQQLEHARSSLEQQILRHEKAMDDVKAVLQHAICDSVVERLKAQIYDAIHENIAKEVESRVQQAVSPKKKDTRCCQPYRPSFSWQGKSRKDYDNRFKTTVEKCLKCKQLSLMPKHVPVMQLYNLRA
ncbi:hypothetical protein H0H87_004128 [Tephrocybe sp. NHM501043]|nr:hypothetical protein H0H87_004128 [Tephrocybe sp. NHM501043]